MTTTDQVTLVASRYAAGGGTIDRDGCEGQLALILERSGKPPETVVFDLAVELVRIKAALAQRTRQET